MTWINRMVLVILIVALALALHALQQPQRFAFRVIEPGAAGTRCNVLREHPDETAVWVCFGPNGAETKFFMQEVPWATR